MCIEAGINKYFCLINGNIKRTLLGVRMSFWTMLSINGGKEYQSINFPNERIDDSTLFLLHFQILVDTAITTVLNRYLLTALGMNPDPLDAAKKCRHVVAALPRGWLQQPGGSDAAAVKTDLARLCGYLVQLGGKGGGGRDFVQDVVNLLKFLGFVEESEKLRRQRLK